MIKDLKIIILGLIIFVLTISIGYSIYNSSNHLNDTEYELQVISINDEFQSILSNERTDNPDINNTEHARELLSKMYAIDEKVYPPQYKEFQDHFKNSLWAYIKWKYDKNEIYLLNGSAELKLAYDSFNKVSVDYTFK